MRSTFNPRFILLQSGYDQGSSGGAGIFTPDNPTTPYCDEDGIAYMWLTEDEAHDMIGPEAVAGYYSIDDDTYYGPDDTGLHACP